MTNPGNTALTAHPLDPALADGLRLPPVEHAASGRTWRLRAGDQATVDAIVAQAGIDPVLARVLAARGVGPAEAGAFLSPSLRSAMPDPLVLKDLDRAIARLSEAVLRGEVVGVFGDYDVDGTTAAAILKIYFDAIGAPLIVHLPDRIADGYGPSIEAFLSLRARGASMIVTVDCGAAAHEPIEQAAAAGLDIVVLDHHQMHGAPPQGAVAIVNPNRPDDQSGLGDLSAAGVAFMAVAALNRALRERGVFLARAEPDLRALLDLAALGLVCDVMPLRGLTRVIVAQGLKVLGAGAEGPGNPGLQDLGQRCGVRNPPTAYDLGFLLGPRINAAGRIGHADLAFELMTTQDASRRAALAETLHRLNAERQDIEAQVEAAAIAEVEARQLASRAVIVVAANDWHPGVIGIVAGRLKERYDRPVIIISLDGAIGKGSGRSLHGVDLGGAIAAAHHAGIVETGGGHAMAAGLSVKSARVDDLSRFLEKALTHDVARALTHRTRDIDAVIAPSAVNRRMAALLAQAGPFGEGNPEPVFVIENVRAEQRRRVGSGHLSLRLVAPGGDGVSAIAFRCEGQPLGVLLSSDARLHVAGKIRPDAWRGGDNAQFLIDDAAPAP